MDENDPTLLNSVLTKRQLIILTIIGLCIGFVIVGLGIWAFEMTFYPATPPSPHCGGTDCLPNGGFPHLGGMFGGMALVCGIQLAAFTAIFLTILYKTSSGKERTKTSNNLIE